MKLYPIAVEGLADFLVVSSKLAISSQERDMEIDLNKKQDIVNRNGIDAMWQPVKGLLGYKFLVYSAYYDKRDVNNPLIRVIGISRYNLARSERLVCRFYFSEQEIVSNVNDDGARISSSYIRKDYETFVDVWAEVELLGERPHYLFYHDCDVLCPLKGNAIPESVSIIPASYRFMKKSTVNFAFQSEITNRLPVINSKNGGTGTYKAKNKNIGVCVKPLWSNYNKPVELIEFIELNKLLGVSKFFFYNESISDEVSCVLRHYMDKEHLVSILPWNLPSKLEVEYIPNRGVMSSLNDCIYRNMNSFGYLMTIDIDEFIVPHMQDSLPKMLDYLDSRKSQYKELEGVMYKRKSAYTIPVKIKKPWRKRRKSSQSKDTAARTITSYNFQNVFFYLGFGKYLSEFYEPCYNQTYILYFDIFLYAYIRYK